MLSAADTVFTQQVLITGFIRDSLNSRPLPGPVSLSLQFQSGLQAPYPLQMRQTAGGFYAFFGDPYTALPILSDPDTLDLQLVATAENYQPSTIPISLTAAELALVETLREIDQQPVVLPRRPALPRTVDITLTPLPRTMIGRIIRADDPAIAIAGATIRVTAPSPVGPATSNENGSYTLINLPVAAEVTVLVTHTDFSDLTTTVRLDYLLPVNEQNFSLA